VKPIRTDFKGYEGKYVATDTRTGQVVIADEDLKIVLEKARKLDHVVVGGRVPHADEPIYVGLGLAEDPLALPLPGGPPANAPGTARVSAFRARLARRRRCIDAGVGGAD
jgi:hypothetical protein